MKRVIIHRGRLMAHAFGLERAFLERSTNFCQESGRLRLAPALALRAKAGLLEMDK